MRRALVFLLTLALALAAHAQDPNLQRGFAAGKAYDFLGLDSVSLMNGNLNVRIPLGQKYSLGPVLEYQFMLAYNSKVWEIEYAGPDAPPPQSWAVPETRSNAGFGWQLTFGALLAPKYRGMTTATNGWTYVSPDGSEHEFPAVHGDTLSYTEDGSYLRLRRLPDEEFRIGYHEIDFPDGTTRQFNGEGQLTELRDRFFYKITINRTATLWTITEKGPNAETGRTHTVDLVTANHAGGGVYAGANFRTLPVAVNLAAFGADNNKATYELAYTHTLIQVGPCSDGQQNAPHYVPWLSTITLPDQSEYTLEYLSTSVGYCTSGTLTKMTVPTGGKIVWTMGTYELANQACIEPRPGIDEYGWRKSHAGVRERRLENANGSLVERRIYTPELPVRLSSTGEIFVPQRCGDEHLNDEIDIPPDVFKNTVVVKAPDGPFAEKIVEKTVSYFSAYPAVVNHTEAGDELKSVAKGIEYGLPFTRVQPVPGAERFLSSEVYACDNAACSSSIVRKTYLKYEYGTTWGVSGDIRTENPRVQAQRTVFEDDSGHFTDSASSNWDGYGHYRQTDTVSSFPGTLDKRTFTQYTPEPTSWLLNTYTDSWVREGTGDTATGTRSRAEFSPTTGTMTSLRTYKATGPDPSSYTQSSSDLLTAWCRDSEHGFVASERFFGGDDGFVPSAPCSASRGAKDYFINHLYSRNGAIVATHTAQYAGLTSPYLIADEVYDRNTGWPSLVRDSAGVTTKYTFDANARILSIRPYDTVETHYNYPAVTGDPKKIAVRQVCPTYDTGTPSNAAECTTASLTKTVYYYDDLGRLIQERKQFPSLNAGVVQSRWAVTTTKYGPLGRTESVTSPIEETSEAYSAPGTGVARTLWDYDFFGRVVTETRPDSSTTTFVYRGGRETERWVGTARRSTETFDGFGRLILVAQTPDASGDVVASYVYNAGGRLTHVRMTAPGGLMQERLFDYDGRGLLRWESHPESGMASYKYDSRGHVTAKDQSAAQTQFDLRFTYDEAERLTELEARNPFYPGTGQVEFRPFKVFTFGTDNGTNGDLRKGKLVTASRFNYGPNSGDEVYKVRDTYAYLDAAGRKTHRTTSIIRMNEYEDVLKDVEMSVTYNALGLPRNMEYPTCSDCGLPPVDPDRSDMIYTYQHGRLQTVDGFIGKMAYWPSGLRRTLEHSNGRTDEQTVGNMARPSRIAFVPTPGNRCVIPTFATQPADAQYPSGGGNVTLSTTVAGTGPFQYQWVRVSDGAYVGSDSSSYTVNLSAPESFYVIVRNPCGHEESRVARVTASCAPPVITEIQSIRQPDGKLLLKPVFTARANPTFSWVSGSQVIGTTETIIVPASVNQQVAYQLTVTNTGSCTGSAQYEIVLTPAPPMTTTDLQAGFQTSPSPRVVIIWPVSFNATSYRVERRSGAEWEYLGETATNSYTDTTIQTSPRRSYAYRAYALRSGGGQSDYSNSDIVTTGTFPQATIGALISATSGSAMLDAVNSVRAAVGWPNVTWETILASTDPLVAPSSLISARHVMSARTRMNEALSALGVPLVPYTDNVLKGVVVKALHINEVSARTQ